MLALPASLAPAAKNSRPQTAWSCSAHDFLLLCVTMTTTCCCAALLHGADLSAAAAAAVRKYKEAKTV